MGDDNSYSALAAEIRGLREDMVEMRSTMGKVADALERLARLEERHSSTTGALERAFKAIGVDEDRIRELDGRVAILERTDPKEVKDRVTDIDNRVKALELEEPVQKLASGWVTNAVYSVSGAVVALAAQKFLGLFA